MSEITCQIEDCCFIDATILVSVDYSGKIDCIEYSNYNVMTHRKAEVWKKQKLQSGIPHTFTFVKVKLPYPENVAKEVTKDETK